MKAYMSDGSERRTREIDADQLDKASAFQWGEMAVVEARRILAETEPALGRIGVMDAAWHGHAVTMRGTEDGMALAEALAAFVADERRN